MRRSFDTRIQMTVILTSADTNQWLFTTLQLLYADISDREFDKEYIHILREWGPDVRHPLGLTSSAVQDILYILNLYVKSYTDTEVDMEVDGGEEDEWCPSSAGIGITDPFYHECVQLMAYVRQQSKK